jgi:putative DNA primase/helicase
MIPKELKDIDQWVSWKQIDTPVGEKKIPIKPDGRPANILSPSDWSPFSRTATDQKGFVFTYDDVYWGVDIDRCLNDNDELSDTSLRIIRTMNSYTEISPSGQGLHIIVKAPKSIGLYRNRGDKEKIEVYKTRRFFTITGMNLPGTTKQIEYRPIELQWLIDNYLPIPKKPVIPGINRKNNNAASEASLAALMSIPKFERLWRGSSIDFGNDMSRGDMSLLRWLTRITKDEDELDKLFRKSDRYREKWDSKRGTTTYGKKTIQKILRT